MNDIVHTFTGSAQTLPIPHISDKEPQLLRKLLKLLRHHPLFEFISGIDDDFLRLIMGQDVSGKALTKGSRAAGYQYCFIF